MKHDAALKMRILYFAILAIFILPIVDAALIGGKVYDYSLNPVTNVNVEINTNPKQRDVADQSVYAFNVPKGSYLITAKQYEGGILKASTRENITVEQDGEYKLDLILFPDVSEEEALADERIIIDKPFDDEAASNGNNTRWGIAVLILLLVLGAAAYFIYFRKMKRSAKHKKRNNGRKAKVQVISKTIALEASEKPEENQVTVDNIEKNSTEDADAKMVIDFIRSQEGRTTQKDIRKNFPSSEAKISLILTDLEAQGKIRKIKKGRGNVVVIK